MCTPGYGVPFDNYLVIDVNGIIRYTSINEPSTSLGRWNEAHVREAILDNVPLSVESRSWTAIKALYASRQRRAEH